MADQTIPLSGAWVLVRREPPTAIKVKPLSIFYAMPEKVFVKGSHEIQNWLQTPNYSSRDLMLLYRIRRGSSSVLDSEREDSEKLEREHRDWYEEELELDQRIKIETPDGTLMLEPPEWTMISDIEPYMDAIGEGYILREYGESAKVSSQIADQIFYMQTRGISKARAIQMLAAGSKSPKLVWLEPEQELVDYFFRRAA